MKTNQVMIIVIALFALLGVIFYWYEYRPSQLKQQCSAEARLDTRAVSESDDVKRQEFINRYYNDCLMRWGLK